MSRTYALPMGGIAVNQVLGRNGDLARAVVGELVALLIAAEDPERGEDQAGARHPGQQQALLAANGFVRGGIAGDRRYSLVRSPIKNGTLGITDIISSTAPTFRSGTRSKRWEHG